MNTALNELVMQHVMGEWPATLGTPRVVVMESIPDYSGDTALAAKVIERMFLKDWRVSLMNGYNGQWFVQFAFSGEVWPRRDTKMGTATEQSCPEAICRAALRALEVQGV